MKSRSRLMVAAIVCLAVSGTFGAIWNRPFWRTTSVENICLAAVPAGTTVPSSKATPEGELIVHEWGTFTSFAGSNGIKLEFRPLANSDLPPFVLDRWTQEGALKNPLGKQTITALQRMETPVIYFYTDTERQVSVKVGFPQGLITEFFPPVVSQQPPLKPAFSEAPEIAKNGSIDWGTVWLIPTQNLASHVKTTSVTAAVDRRIAEAMPPRVGWDSHYRPARKTDSALVYVNRPENKERPMVPQGDFFEKFLFYRGIGNFDLPLTVEAQGKGHFAATNSGPNPIRGLFLVNVTGNELRFANYSEIGPGQTLKMQLPTSISSVDELSAAVVAALGGEKLYEKEARAMVATWQTSWFGEQGTRLFYVLPRSMTDDLLPLDIAPKPDELVRVLVGRLEIMTPEDEQRVTKFVRDSAGNRKYRTEQAAKSGARSRSEMPLPNVILHMGRLGEPMLARVQTSSDDPVVKNEAGILLQQLTERLKIKENAGK